MSATGLCVACVFVWYSVGGIIRYVDCHTALVHSTKTYPGARNTPSQPILWAKHIFDLKWACLCANYVAHAHVVNNYL